MPIYEYVCDSCGKEFEELVFSDEPPACPACASAATHKLLSATKFRMPGGVSAGGAAPSSGGSGGCSGCSGGSCATCK